MISFLIIFLIFLIKSRTIDFLNILKLINKKKVYNFNSKWKKAQLINSHDFFIFNYFNDNEANTPLAGEPRKSQYY